MEKSSIIDDLKRKGVDGKEELKKLQKEMEEERVLFVKKVEMITLDMSKKEKEILMLTSKK